MSDPARVVILAGQLVVGGAERQLYLWLANMNRKRYQPIILTLHPDQGDFWETPIQALGVPLIRIAPSRFPPVRLARIIQIIRHHRPRLIHGWHLFTSPYAGLAAKWLGTCSVGSVRGSFNSISQPSLESILTPFLVDVLLVNSSTVARQIESGGKKRPRVVAVPNAVESSAADRPVVRQQLAARYGLPADRVWIGSVGRLAPGKGFDTLLKILRMVKEAGQAFHFLLIGDGPERFRLEMLTQELSLSDSVTFTGELPGAAAWMPALDIFAFASLDEGLPNVVMEAAAAGVPVVAWKLPFVQELLNDGGAGGLVALAGGMDGFKAILLELAQSSTLRARIGQAGKQQMLEGFGISNYAERMTKLYESLLTDT